MDTIRWGIIGCGDVTEVKSGPALQLAPGSELVAVMRRDAAKAEDYARRHNVPRWYDDADQLFSDPDVNAIYVATPPSSHEVYALKSCAAGKPCYVEKPMARNAAEAKRMVEAFAAHGLPLFVAYYRRALPRFLKAREIIASGALGKLQRVSYRYADGQMCERREPVPWRLQAEEAGAGLFLDLGSHALDILDYCFGPLEQVRGATAKTLGLYDVEDSVDLTFVTGGGVSGSASWDFTSESRADEYCFTGEAGELRFSCFGQETVRVRYRDGSEDAFDLPNPRHIQQPLIELIVAELLGKGSASPSTGVSALRTQRVMDAALQEFYNGREDGFWERRRIGAQ